MQPPSTFWLEQRSFQEQNWFEKREKGKLLSSTLRGEREEGGRDKKQQKRKPEWVMGEEWHCKLAALHMQ